MSEAPRKCPPDELAEIKLLVPPHLYRAFQRCVWLQINQTGKTQLEIMEKMVRDFLIEHQC